VGFLDQLSFLLPGFESPTANSPSVHDNGTATQPKLRKILLAGQPYDWVLTRSSRKTVGMTILNGLIKVTAPKWVSIEEIETILTGKSRWLINRHQEWLTAQRNRLEPAQQWSHGASLQFLGQSTRIELDPLAGEIVWDAGAQLLKLPLPPAADHEQVRDRVHGWMQQQAKEILVERLDLLAQQAGLQYSHFQISHAKGRWGSCTQDGRIRLNWRLVQFSLPVIDYVVAHELAHLRAMDRSPGFWSEVAKILPNFEQGRSVLKGVRLED
jgi:predicted metal-dependent hydrolase